MASEHYKCKPGPLITDIEEDEQISSGIYYVDVRDILNREIKEEPTESKAFSESGVSNGCQENNEDGTFFYSNPDSSKFEVMLRDGVVDPTESKISTAHFWENRNFNGLADELAKHKVSHFINGVVLKNEIKSECNDDSLTNNVELKMEAHETKDDIDIIYEDVKPEICDEKSSGNSENRFYLNSVTNILIGTEIGPNFSPELSKDSETWPPQNRGEDETDVERNNDKRKEPTITIDSKNYQTIQKLPPFESEQEFEEIPDTEGKPFQCKSCSKSFTAKQNLVTHERIHTDQKPYQCKICYKLFAQKVHVKQHERIHTGEKPFQCLFCSKSFARKYCLGLHQKIHTGGERLQCKICTILFSRRDYFTRHMRIHTGGKKVQKLSQRVLQ